MADSNSILSSERKEKEEVIDKALRPTRLKDYAGQDGIREQLDLFITASAPFLTPLFPRRSFSGARPRRSSGSRFALRPSGLR